MITLVVPSMPEAETIAETAKRVVDTSATAATTPAATPSPTTPTTPVTPAA